MHPLDLSPHLFPHVQTSKSKWRRALGAIITVAALGACEKVVEEGRKPAPRHAEVAQDESFCVEGASARGLSGQSNERLWALYGHYYLCRYDERARDAAFGELIRREDPDAEFEMANRLYDPNAPEPALEWARKAADHGSIRAKSALERVSRGETW